MKSMDIENCKARDLDKSVKNICAVNMDKNIFALNSNS